MPHGFDIARMCRIAAQLVVLGIEFKFTKAHAVHHADDEAGSCGSGMDRKRPMLFSRRHLKAITSVQPWFSYSSAVVH